MGENNLSDSEFCNKYTNQLIRGGKKKEKRKKDRPPTTTFYYIWILDSNFGMASMCGPPYPLKLNLESL
jgi:hypothetical protein